MNNYTPDWVRGQISSKGKVERVTIDMSSHPLDETKSSINYNKPIVYFRFKEYPFWIQRSNIDYPLLINCKIVTFNDFCECIKYDDIKHVYQHLVHMWNSTTDNKFYDETRQALIIVSKSL